VECTDKQRLDALTLAVLNEVYHEGRAVTLAAQLKQVMVTQNKLEDEAIKLIDKYNKSIKGKKDMNPVGSITEIVFK
jgi:ATP-dependent Clp protease ATP-binding subunit ClpA